jgi:hypothetical protein
MSRWSYFYSGVMVLFLSWALTGCRFGNHLELPQSEPTVNGYYATQIQSLRYCSVLKNTDGSTATSCQSADTRNVPDFFFNIFTNPVILYLDDPASGTGTFRNKIDTSLGVHVNIGTDGKLSWDYVYDPSSFAWVDPGCLMQTEVVEDGRYTQDKNLGTSADGIPLSGSVQLDIQRIDAFAGDTETACDSTFTQLAQCYQDSSTCGGTSDADNTELTAEVQSFFNPYIEAGVMSASDIARVRALSYEAVYN